MCNALSEYRSGPSSTFETFLCLDFQCRDDVSELEYIFISLGIEKPQSNVVSEQACVKYIHIWQCPATTQRVTELGQSPKHVRDACLVGHSEDDQSEHLRDEPSPEMNPCLSHHLLHAQNFTRNQID